MLTEVMSEVRIKAVHGWLDYLLGESLEVTLRQDSVVLGIAVAVESLNSVTDEADLTLESLDPVGRGGRSSMVGGSHWNEKLVKQMWGVERRRTCCAHTQFKYLWHLHSLNFFFFFVGLLPFCLLCLLSVAGQNFSLRGR